MMSNGEWNDQRMKYIIYFKYKFIDLIPSNMCLGKEKN